MEYKVNEVLTALNIKGTVLNVYPYGSRVYKTNNSKSDNDYIIVMKAGILESGAFRDNAISNDDKSIQGIVYSRGGFQDAINNYDMGALECIFLEDQYILKNTWPFKLNKLIKRDLIKKVISKASNSWHIAKQQYKDGNIEHAKKGVWHALRILEFGEQIVKHNKIINYSSCNKLKDEIDSDNNFKINDYVIIRDSFIKTLRNIK